MKKHIRLAALAAAVLTASTNLTPTAAQSSAPEFNKKFVEAPPPTDAIILKYRAAAQFRELDVEATTKAINAARAMSAGNTGDTTGTTSNVTVAPVHRLAANQVTALSLQAGTQLSQEREMSGDAFVLKLPQPLPYDEVSLIANRLAQLGEVEYAEPSGRKHVTFTPDDTRYGEQWHYSAPISGSYGANLPAAWDVMTGSISTVVAVVDTGIRCDHPDLVGRVVSGTGCGGYDFITDVPTANDGNGRDADATDPGDYGNCPPYGTVSSSWHGTHVAGTIGANSNNGVGVTGINWVSKILPIRVLGKCGGDDADIIDGMRWAAGLSVPGVTANLNPARVLNLSLGGVGPCSNAFKNAINEIIALGTVIVVAAGNDNGSASSDSPGNCPNVVTVAATNRNGNRASYSNYGSVVEISAPGGESGSDGVLSTLNAGTTTPGASNYVFYKGTSMAAPHVAGIASLMYSINPLLSATQAVSLLQSSATTFPMGSTCNTSICGAGIVNAAAAVQAAKDAPLVTPTPTPPSSKFVNLPIVVKSSDPTAGGSLVNGNFEQGWTAGWTTVTQFPCSGTYDPAVCDPVIYQNDEFFLEGAAPHSGSWAAWLGGFNNANVLMRQSVKVPSNAPYLAFWQMIGSNDLCTDADDVASITANGAMVKKINVCFQTSNYPNWAKQVVDLSAYKDQSVSLEFALKTDSLIVSSWLLDDIAFQASP